MKMAKPHDYEILAAEQMFQILRDVECGRMPFIDGAESEDFDEYNYEHLREFYRACVKTIEDAPNWPGKIIGGMCWVILNPDNQLLDSTKNYIELHPDLREGLAIVQQRRETMLDRMEDEARDALAYFIEDYVWYHKYAMNRNSAAYTTRQNANN